MEDTLKLTGNVRLHHIRGGAIIDTRAVKNLVTNAGLALVAGLIVKDVGGTAFDEIAIGTGTTAAALTDTILQAEITTSGGQRRTGANVTGTRVTTDVTNDTAQWVTTFTFTGSFAVTEVGIFNDPTTGTLLARAVFAAINVVSGDSLQITYKVDLD